MGYTPENLSIRLHKKIVGDRPLIFAKIGRADRFFIFYSCLTFVRNIERKLEIANESTQSHVLGTKLNETLTKCSRNDRTKKVLCFFL